MKLFFSALVITLFGIETSAFALVPLDEYHLHTQKPNGVETCRLSCVVAVKPDMVATIIPSRFLTANFPTNLSVSTLGAMDSKSETPSSIPCRLFSKELLTGLVLLKLDTPLPSPPPDQIPSTELKKETPIIFKNPSGEMINGIYVGIEHTFAGVHFPLPLLRVHFPALKIPFLGQACYTDKGKLAGLVIGTSPQGICRLLPTEAIAHLVNAPNSKRAKLGCLLDISGNIPEIIDLVDGGPMQKAGIKVGDIIVSINDIPINSYKDFLNVTYYLPSNEPITLKVIRKNYVTQIEGILPAESER